jgi:hypothetical protein
MDTMSQLARSKVPEKQEKLEPGSQRINLFKT